MAWKEKGITLGHLISTFHWLQLICHQYNCGITSDCKVCFEVLGYPPKSQNNCSLIKKLDGLSNWVVKT
jgi:hypothetical protein